MNSKAFRLYLRLVHVYTKQRRPLEHLQRIERDLLNLKGRPTRVG